MSIRRLGKLAALLHLARRFTSERFVKPVAGAIAAVDRPQQGVGSVVPFYFGSFEGQRAQSLSLRDPLEEAMTAAA
jgi:hypothetical protein